MRLRPFILSLALLLGLSLSVNAQKDVATLAGEDANFSNLIMAVNKAGLTEVLKKVGPITVFAPSNRAFDDVDETKLNNWFRPGMESYLREILAYHIIPGAYTSEDFVKMLREDDDNNVEFYTFAGQVISVRLDGASIELEDQDGNRSEIEAANIAASNGMIHVVDEVLVPNMSSSRAMNTTPSRSTSMEVKNIVEFASGVDQFSTLVDAVTAADLAEFLQDDGPYTVFAPTNAAFAAVPSSTLNSLMQPSNKAKLQSILKYHIIDDEALEAADLMEIVEDKEGKAELKTLTGEKLWLTISDGALRLTDSKGNTFKVTDANIPASNGVIHAIDGVLMPGTKKKNK